MYSSAGDVNQVIRQEKRQEKEKATKNVNNVERTIKLVPEL